VHRCAATEAALRAQIERGAETTTALRDALEKADRGLQERAAAAEVLQTEFETGTE
jgi:hypothetical protein